MVEAGHWFLKHRKNGETPHRRFVFARGDSIFWSTREDRGGKLGQMDGPGLMVVPGAAFRITHSLLELVAFEYVSPHALYPCLAP